jgi:integrase
VSSTALFVIDVPLLPGVGVHSNGQSLRVRLRPFPEEAGYILASEANERILELRRLKRAGITVAPPRRTEEIILAEAARLWLRKLDRDGGSRGAPLTPGGRREYRRAANPWIGVRLRDEIPEAIDSRGRLLADCPLSQLRKWDVDEYLATRRIATPKQAREERHAFLSILKLARERGDVFADELLLLRPIPRAKTTVGRALELEELRFLAARAPEHQRRWYLLGGTIGARIMSLLRAEESWLDLVERTLTIPPAHHKSGNATGEPVIIDLLDEEVALLREQLLVRAPGTTLLFPRKYGSPWSHGHFHRKTWTPTLRRARRDWRSEHGLEPDAPTPFDGLRPHDLRHTAATVLCDHILDDGLVAIRMGHSDGGKLVRERYRHISRRKLREELDRIDAAGGLGR